MPFYGESRGVLTRTEGFGDVLVTQTCPNSTYLRSTTAVPPKTRFWRATGVKRL